MKIDKYDLWGIISIIVSAMLLSLAMAIESNSVFLTFVMCVLFTTFCFHLVTFSIKLHNLRKEEKFQTIMGYINCSDRVAPVPQPLVKFKKGDWIVRKDDNGTIFQIKDIVLRGVLLYYTFQTSNAPMYNDTEDIHPTIIIDGHYRLATPEEIQQHGITIDTNE